MVRGVLVPGMITVNRRRSFPLLRNRRFVQELNGQQTIEYHREEGFETSRVDTYINQNLSDTDTGSNTAQFDLLLSRTYDTAAATIADLQQGIGAPNLVVTLTGTTLGFNLSNIDPAATETRIYSNLNPATGEIEQFINEQRPLVTIIGTADILVTGLTLNGRLKFYARSFNGNVEEQNINMVELAVGDAANEAAHVVETLEFLNTGAAATGDEQRDPAASTGGNVSSTPSLLSAHFIRFGFPQLEIIRTGAFTNEGVGVLNAVDVNTLQWKAPTDTAFGPSTKILPGETKTLFPQAGYDGHLVVKRTASTPFTGSVNVELAPVIGNATAQQVFTVGDEQYSCIALNDLNLPASASAEATTPLVENTVMITGATHAHVQILPASGAGTIELNASNTDFSAWPESGFVRISDTGETLEELIYYTSRTDTTLTVTGRALAGTSEQTMTNQWRLRAVGGFTFGFETLPLSSGSPALAWRCTTTDLTPANPQTANLNGSLMGLWIRKAVPADATADPDPIYHAIQMRLSVGNYDDVILFLTGKNRGIRDPDLVDWLVYIGQDQEPDFDAAPAITSATLPIDQNVLTADTTHHIVVRKRNSFGVISRNVVSTIIRTDSNNDPLAGDPPEIFELTATPRGYKVRLKAFAENNDAESISWSVTITQETSGAPDVVTSSYNAIVDGGLIMLDQILTLKDATALPTQTGSVTIEVTTAQAGLYGNTASVTFTVPGDSQNSPRAQVWTGRRAHE